MDYDKSDIAAIYDEARVITSERLRQWQEVLSTQLDRTAISVVVDLGCGTGRFTESLATHFGAQVIGIVNCICSPGRASPSRTTATGLPLKGTAVKTSTCWKAKDFMLVSC